MNIKIVIATHKKYKLPTDEIYLPVQSGSALYPNLGYQKDNEGDNISHKNIAYNIMCVMYWAWKNLDCDYIGIVHYRRLFMKTKHLKNRFENILTKKDAEELLLNTDIILSPKRYYPFFTIKSHYIYTKAGYANTHKRDIQVLREVINDLCNEYVQSFDVVMKKNNYHSGHLLIMKKDLYNKYCTFIFTVGDEFENRLKNERPDLTRYVASVTELLVDVWIHKHGYSYQEVGLYESEKVSFFMKLYLFLRRMFTGYYKGTQ